MFTIGGAAATVSYSGLAPGLVGIYHFNVAVPTLLPTRDLVLQMSLNGVANGLQNLYLPVSAAATGNFTLMSAAGGTLPSDYTCDRMGSTIQLS